jgi:hypothetical protein
MECHSLNVSAKVSGVHLGGGISYTESLLRRFGILGPDGGPGEGLLRGLKDLSSSLLAKLFKSSHLTEKEGKLFANVPFTLLYNSGKLPVS